MEYLVEDVKIDNDFVSIKISYNNNIEYYKIHSVAFANYYFSKGNKITKDFLNNLLEENKYYIVKDQVIKRLKIKDYTQNQVIEYLSDKLDEYQIDRLIKDLEKNNYLNDYNFIKKIFNDARLKYKGKQYIHNQLKDKGLSEKLVNSFFEHYNENDIAARLVKQEFDKLNGKYPKNTIIKKIIYKLNYNGFSEEIIYEESSKLENMNIHCSESVLVNDCKKLINKYQNKFKNRELQRKVIESLLVKGYNYKSASEVVERMIKDD